MPFKAVHIQMEERELRRLREELLRRKTDEGAEHVCVRCGCVFRAMNGRIDCPFCGLEYAPTVE